MPYGRHLPNRGGCVSRDFSGTFTRYTTPKQAGELVASGFENADEKIFFKGLAIPRFQKKTTSIFLVQQYWKWQQRFLQHLMTQNRPFAFFRFTCFQAGSALYSSRVMSSADWKEGKKRPEWKDPTTSHACCAQTLSHLKKHLPRNPRRWDKSPASEGQLPRAGAWLGGRPVDKWFYTAWLRHLPPGWSDLKLPCPGEEGAERGTSMSHIWTRFIMCLKACPPGPSAPHPGDPARGDEALSCHLTLHGISDASGKKFRDYHTSELSRRWLNAKLKRWKHANNGICLQIFKNN